MRILAMLLAMFLAVAVFASPARASAAVEATDSGSLAEFDTPWMPDLSGVGVGTDTGVEPVLWPTAAFRPTDTVTLVLMAITDNPQMRTYKPETRAFKHWPGQLARSGPQILPSS